MEIVKVDEQEKVNEMDRLIDMQIDRQTDVLINMGLIN